MKFIVYETSDKNLKISCDLRKWAIWECVNMYEVPWHQEEKKKDIN